jgi:hypothetical protein
MSEDPHCGFLNPNQCRELLIRIDERVGELHKTVKGNGKAGLEERVEDLESHRDKLLKVPTLEQRIDSLESDRDKVKGLAIIGGVTGFGGLIAALGRWLIK